MRKLSKNKGYRIINTSFLRPTAFLDKFPSNFDVVSYRCRNHSDFVNLINLQQFLIGTLSAVCLGNWRPQNGMRLAYVPVIAD